MVTIEEIIKTKEELNKKWFDITSENPNELKNTGLGFRFLEIDYAIKAIKDKDFQKAKQHFYTASLIDEICIGKFNDNQLSYGLRSTCYPILSDNEELIQRYAKLRYQPWGKMKGMDENILLGKSDIWSNTIQFFMVNDNEGIERNLNIIETKTLSKLPKNQKGLIIDYEFYKALYMGDKAQMEEVLEKLVSPKVHKKRSFNELHAQYISLLALGYAKLAWRKGIEVEVNTSLIPKELLPVQPNEKYEIPYDFLKENKHK